MSGSLLGLTSRRRWSNDQKKILNSIRFACVACASFLDEEADGGRFFISSCQIMWACGPKMPTCGKILDLENALAACSPSLFTTGLVPDLHPKGQFILQKTERDLGSRMSPFI